jgi:hypothetical protein
MHGQVTRIIYKQQLTSLTEAQRVIYKRLDQNRLLLLWGERTERRIYQNIAAWHPLPSGYVCFRLSDHLLC